MSKSGIVGVSLAAVLACLALPLSAAAASNAPARATAALATADPDRDAQAGFLASSRAEHDRKAAWTTVKTWTFDDAADLDDLRPVQGQWEIRDGKLRAAGGEPERARTILLAPCRWPWVRVAFDAVLQARPDGAVCDLAVRLNADPATGGLARGYALMTAQYMNQATVCYRLNIPIARTEWSPIVPGQTHRVVLEFTGDHLRYWVDGRVVLDAWDRAEPLAMDPERWLALSTHDTVLAVDNLTIQAGEPAGRGGSDPILRNMTPGVSDQTGR